MARIIRHTDLDSLSNNTVVLTQAHPLAVERNFLEPFRVEIRLLDRTLDTKLQMKYADNENKLGSDYFKEVFKTSIVAWDNLFVNEEGENIPASNEWKDLVFEKAIFSDEYNLINDFIMEIKGLKIRKEDNVKKNVESDLSTIAETTESVENAQ